MQPKPDTNRTISFLKDENGFISPFAISVILIILLFSGISLDSSNAFQARAIMQTAADASAHAAVMDLPDTDTALTTALTYANINLSPDARNSAITSDGVEFGLWDPDTRTFTETETEPDAVRVTATRSSANDNALPTFLLFLAGLSSWDIEVQAIAYRAGDPPAACQNLSVITDGEFSMAEDNEFYGNYCIHAVQGMSLSSGNNFDDTNALSVGSYNDISWSGSVNMSTIVGRGTSNSSASLTYEDIFQESSKTSPYVTDIETLADNYLEPFYSEQPSYINTSAAVIEITAKDVKYTDFIPGRIYEVACGGKKGKKAQFFNGAVIDQVVIVSECKIQLGKNSVFTDVVLISRSTKSKSIYAAKGVQLGEDDSCDPSGGVSIYTAGKFDSDSDLQMFGVFISAVGKVKIRPESDAIADLTIYAGDDVEFTSDFSIGTCTTTAGADDEEDGDGEDDGDEDNSVYSYLIVQ